MSSLDRISQNTNSIFRRTAKGLILCCTCMVLSDVNGVTISTASAQTEQSSFAPEDYSLLKGPSDKLRATLLQLNGGKFSEEDQEWLDFLCGDVLQVIFEFSLANCQSTQERIMLTQEISSLKPEKLLEFLFTTDTRLAVKLLCRDGKLSQILNNLVTESSNPNMKALRTYFNFIRSNFPDTKQGDFENETYPFNIVYFLQLLSQGKNIKDIAKLAQSSDPEILAALQELYHSHFSLLGKRNVEQHITDLEYAIEHPELSVSSSQE